METSAQLNKPKKPLISQILVILVMAALLSAESYFGYKLYTLSAQQEQLKEDYSTANNITFGVFSLDLWRDKLSGIVTNKIKSFKVTKEQKQELKEEVEKQLHGMIDQVVHQFNKPQKSLGDKLKKFAFKQLVEPKELHAQVPSFAQTIVNRINSPRAIKKLKGIANTEFNELAEQIYDSTATAQSKVSSYLFKKYKVNNISTFNKHLETELEEIRKTTYNYAYAMLGCALLAICLWLPLRKKQHLHTPLFIMSLLVALALLLVGATVSIIEVDARLSTLEIHLLGEKIAFSNQVLFFQSKSILGVAEVLLQQPKPDSITVGILIIVFVLILPILRMIARGIHLLCKPPIAENKVNRYLTFEAGKWDMADVMVVGILMTYIGLNGILQSQLGGLNMKTETLVTTTVNYTSLQPGYIIFVGYVALTIALSFILKKVDCPPQDK
ncbi:paraquat-inducible protein A [Pedobacter xixiisoli]|uniref:Paraquat-inducible protein A n=1 Tax=Pedobacter xixiisoli TaxID=1476464 RepID=A0A285ZRK2_9SPHI|nr:paraquat-inducible protein A [Pedobacter xixiisoli]SOD12268.1 Paraquat-inducible protein A [Pedobacter xixiisoli]